MMFIASPWLFGFTNENGTACNLFVALGWCFCWCISSPIGTPKSALLTTIPLVWAWADTGLHIRPGP
ncbi:hypothetical protein J4E00_27830 [Siccationidurans soli]|uniref:Uncharacterized protein n=1 Tax=Hymenobacter negativus TaxID=2795026 RepID=A0ABS3QNP6_9BACT|nr:hypothetical protein [Hymenobacter negativus]